MLEKWHYLVGTEEELRPVWNAYWLDPYRDELGQDNDAHGHSSDEAEDAAHDHSTADVYSGVAGERYLVGHATPVFLIDRAGHRRVLFSGPSLNVEPLVHDIQLLTK